jgi:hypothetical protein
MDAYGQITSPEMFDYAAIAQRNSKQQRPESRTQQNSAHNSMNNSYDQADQSPSRRV